MAKNLKFKAIKVTASWCGKCRQIPWTDEDGITLDADDTKNLQIIEKYNIRQLPFFILEVADETDKLIDAKTLESPDTRSEVDKWLIKERMLILAAYNKYSITNNFDKIVNARYNMHLNWNQCPCGGDNRGCISELCHKEIKENGVCHCNCFKLLEE